MARHADHLQPAARQHHHAVKPRRVASRDDARALAANQLQLAVQPQLLLVDVPLLLQIAVVVLQLLTLAVAVLQLHVW
jgi:hypothetical protein